MYWNFLGVDTASSIPSSQAGKDWVWGLERWLRSEVALAAPGEGQSSGPTWWPTTCYSSCRRSGTLLWWLQVLDMHLIHRYRHATHTYMCYICIKLIYLYLSRTCNWLYGCNQSVRYEDISQETCVLCFGYQSIETMDPRHWDSLSNLKLWEDRGVTWSLCPSPQGDHIE